MKTIATLLLALTVFTLANCIDQISLSSKPKAGPMQGLSWDNDASRLEWSKYLLTTIGGDFFKHFDAAKDSNRFCTYYADLSKEQRVRMWAEVIIWTSFYESSWNPKASSLEPTMGIDPVTKLPVRSEGLMQMSYQDVPNYKAWLGADWCAFDYKKKNIYEPLLNLECAIKVMSNQIDRTGKMILSSGVYWSTLKDGGRYSKTTKIISNVKKSVGSK